MRGRSCNDGQRVKGSRRAPLPCTWVRQTKDLRGSRAKPATPATGASSTQPGVSCGVYGKPRGKPNPSRRVKPQAWRRSWRCRKWDREQVNLGPLGSARRLRSGSRHAGPHVKLAGRFEQAENTASRIRRGGELVRRVQHGVHQAQQRLPGPRACACEEGRR